MGVFLSIVNSDLSGDEVLRQESPRDVDLGPFRASALTPRVPIGGLLHSATCHVALMGMCLYPPLAQIFSAPRIVPLQWDELQDSSVLVKKLADSRRSSAEQVQSAMAAALQSLPAMSWREGASSSAPLATPVQSASVPTYSGPQEIVSLLPDATNSVQTIRRPDLETPPVLKFAQLLKPVVNLPSAQAADRDARVAMPVALPALNPVVRSAPIEVPTGEPAIAPDPKSTAEQARPIAQPSLQTAHSKVAVVILNSVMVPENTPALIPEAELAGNFVVMPVASSLSTAEGRGVDHALGSKKATDEAIGLRHSESAHSSDILPKALAVEEDRRTAGVGSDMGRGSGLPRTISTASGATAATSSTGVPSSPGVQGITIIGGTSRSGGHLSVSSSPHASYGLTVISSGTSGGASRDLGVFGRGETVYTVYIPMADVGGGPDWSFQYTIVTAMPSSGGMLTPPVAVKKARAILAQRSADEHAIVFLRGVISATGVLDVSPPAQLDTRTRCALDALRQWRFLPSKLNGIAVAIKIVIGAAIVQP